MKIYTTHYGFEYEWTESIKVEADNKEDAEKKTIEKLNEKYGDNYFIKEFINY